MSCKCKLGLGSFEQCETVEIELRDWKPAELDRSLYTVPSGDLAATYINPYLEGASIVESLSKLESGEVEAFQKNLEDSKSKKTAAFWLTAGIAFLVLK